MLYPSSAEVQLAAQPLKSMDTHTHTDHTVPTPVIHDPLLLDFPEQDDSNDNFLIVSPYRSRAHLLSLQHLHPNQQLLAKALTSIQPIRPDYATCPYPLAFNRSTVTEVIFRSQIPPTTSRAHLAALDRAAHIEATKSGGLLKYWFGVPDQEGRNLATCKSRIC